MGHQVLCLEFPKRSTRGGYGCTSKIKSKITLFFLLRSCVLEVILDGGANFSSGVYAFTGGWELYMSVLWQFYPG